MSNGRIIKLGDANVGGEGLGRALAGLGVRAVQGALLDVAGTNDKIDVGPVYDLIAANARTFLDAMRNPLDVKPFLALAGQQRMAASIHRGVAQYGSVASLVHPILGHFNQQSEAIAAAIRIRQEHAHQVLRAPFQIVPCDYTIVNGFPTGAYTIKNPYLGSTGGSSDYNGAWAVTAIRTGSLMNSFSASGGNTSIGGMMFTSFTFGGHEYVGGALAGLTPPGTGTSTGLGYPTQKGWPFYAFAEDARKEDRTHFQPWNLTSSGGLYGAIMSETGQIVFTIGNNQPTGSGIATGCVAIYIKATLCGLPWKKETVREHFVAPSKSMEVARRMLMHFPAGVAGYFGETADMQSSLAAVDPSNYGNTTQLARALPQF